MAARLGSDARNRNAPRPFAPQSGEKSLSPGSTRGWREAPDEGLRQRSDVSVGANLTRLRRPSPRPSPR